jgi:amidase
MEQGKHCECFISPHAFLPSKFYNAYNATTLPVLQIRPEDIVSTESLDALDFDKDSIKRAERGNPLTGPFYIEGASKLTLSQ